MDGRRVIIGVGALGSIGYLTWFIMLLFGHTFESRHLGVSFLTNAILLGALAYGAYHGENKKEESE